MITYDPELFLNIGDFILLSAVPSLALFVGFYYFKSNWKKYRVGRSLMAFAASLLAITVVVLLSIFLGPDYPGREWVRILCYGTVSFTCFKLFRTLRHIQKRQAKGFSIEDEMREEDAIFNKKPESAS